MALAVVCAESTAAAATGSRFRPVTRKESAPLKVLDRFVMKDGRDVSIIGGSLALIENPTRHTRMIRHLPQLGMLTHNLVRATRDQELAAIAASPVPAHPYVDGEVVVVLRSGTRLPDRLSLTTAQVRSLHLAPGAKRAATAEPYAYTADTALNHALNVAGVSSVKHLFDSIGSSRLTMIRERARNPQNILPIENTYLLTIANATVPAAVERLRTVTSVLYASPNFRITPMDTQALPLTKNELTHATDIARSGDAARAVRLGNSSAFSASKNEIPTNYAVEYSAQSALNAPGVNDVAAYDEIENHFHQLPGQGEIITNVSVGDITDYTTAQNTSSPCNVYATTYGPTATILSGQHYLAFPAMPLIPAWVSDTSGDLSGSGVSCGEDPYLQEVGLDFSVMAPLPHDLQRNTAVGSGYSDLLGIAPGAQYRLIVPQSDGQGLGDSDLAGALLGAISQTPAPNVINMSIGFGFDEYGFPSRYLEEDPLMRSIVASVVAQGIVVCIAAGDGLRMYTNAAVGPSGGTVPIDAVTSNPTNIVDDELSTTPSRVIDTGSIAVGGTTLDDIMSAPPYQPEFAKYRDQLTFPQTRWNGFGSFASSFGSRVNISAPSDNILADDTQGTALQGGTSAAAPMVAAGAAVALQIARLTGKPFTDPQNVRAFLTSTARTVPNVLQADVNVNVGPQLDLGNVVETLLRKANVTMKPALNRVAIAQRYPDSGEFVFTTDTDPSEIDLTDKYAEYPEAQLGSAAFAPITIAPDWEALPTGTKFRLSLSSSPNKVLGTGPWTRIFPSELLAAAGYSLYAATPRTVSVTYRAYVGFHTIAQATIGLTFAPNAKILQGVGPAPTVPSVVTGQTIPVKYDISEVDPSAISSPQLIVSYPGRMATWTAGDPGYKAVYTVPITQKKGTIQVPVSALQGDGIYGFAIQINTWAQLGDGYSIGLTNAPVATIFSYARVATVGSARPAAPVLNYLGDTTFPAESGHEVDVTFNHPFQLSWNVSNVAGATGAMLEISAAGPSYYGNYNMFNNPNGSVIDENSVDNGSSYELPLSGAKGTSSVNPWSKLIGTEYYTVRVLPMSGGRVVGEASDESTLVTHGVIPADGGLVIGGFDVNPAGSDAILASNQLDATGRVDTSIETFDPSSDLITANISELSTDAGPAAAANVPMYDLAGLGMNYYSRTAVVGVNNAPYPDVYASYQSAAGLTLPYSSPISNCEYCTQITAPANTQWLGFGSSGVFDYGLTATPTSAYAVQPLTNNQFGTPAIPVPNPIPGSYTASACNGFAVSGGGAFISFWNGGSGIYVQPVQANSGAVQPVIPMTGWAYTTCNISALSDANFAMIGAQRYGLNAEGVTTIGQSGWGYTTFNTLPMSGYIPIGIAELYGTQIVQGWAVTSALQTNYLTNDNAIGALDVVDESLSYHGTVPFGSYDNVPIPTNNRFIAGGPGGTLYLLGVNGYEVAPLVTGL
jgi:hypothetical protein